jgi:hypothetical protein
VSFICQWFPGQAKEAFLVAFGPSLSEEDRLLAAIVASVRVRFGGMGCSKDDAEVIGLAYASALGGRFVRKQFEAGMRAVELYAAERWPQDVYCCRVSKGRYLLARWLELVRDLSDRN